MHRHLHVVRLVRPRPRACGRAAGQGDRPGRAPQGASRGGTTRTAAPAGCRVRPTSRTQDSRLRLVARARRGRGGCPRRAACGCGETWQTHRSQKPAALGRGGSTPSIRTFPSRPRDGSEGAPPKSSRRCARVPDQPREERDGFRRAGRARHDPPGDGRIDRARPPSRRPGRPRRDGRLRRAARVPARARPRTRDQGRPLRVRALRRADAAGGCPIRPGRPRPRCVQPAQVHAARAEGTSDDPAAPVRRRTSSSSEDDLGDELRSLAPAILSRRAGRGYLGYLHGQKERLLGVARPETRQPARARRGARLRHEVRDACRPPRLPGPRAARDRPGHAPDVRARAVARDGDPHRRADVRRRRSTRSTRSSGGWREALERTSASASARPRAVDRFLVDAYRRAWGW